VEIFEDPIWQMSLGERAAVEGVLAQLQPSLAIEIGSAEGACLRRIAAYAGEVHSFDLQPPSLELPDNVTLHTGDSHELLAPFLAELSEQDRNIDLVIVDGDHSPEGVRQDLEDMLDSRALACSIILIHDAANERVRRGVDAVHFAAWPKVAHVELDWIPGQLFAEPALRNELWFGLGLVIVDSARLAYMNGSVYEQRYHPAAHLFAQLRDQIVARERVPPGLQAPQDEANALRKRLAELGVELAAARMREAELTSEMVILQHRIAGAERALENITGSVSWRMTEPLRGAKRRAGRRTKG
jgi:Methyltransferase domain